MSAARYVCCGVTSHADIRASGLALKLAYVSFVQSAINLVAVSAVDSVAE